MKRAGEERDVTIAEALLLALERMTMTGNVRADKILMKLRHRYAPEPDHAVEPGILLAPEAPSEEEWIRQQEILNRWREKPDEGGSPSQGGGAGTPPGSPPSPSGSPGPRLPGRRPPGRGTASAYSPKPSMRGRLIR